MPRCAAWLNTAASSLPARSPRRAARSTPVARIARWNGSSWQPLGGGIDNTGTSLVVHGGELFVGGLFSSAGGVSSRGIAGWDGSSWHGLDGGVANAFPFPATVEALALFDGHVIAAGRFGNAGGVAAANVAAWDGSAWVALGDGLGGGGSPLGAFAVTAYRGRLIAAGSFGTAGTQTASSIAAWDGSSWSPMGSGLDSLGYALLAAGPTLYVGGEFMNAGGAATPGIAVWSAPTLAAGAVPDGGRIPGIPLTVRKLVVPGSIALDWGASCSGDDIDYAVYAGSLGEFESHQPLTCSSGGGRSFSLFVGADAYYLVVPQTLDFEGSYGLDSQGVERSSGPAACAAQAIASCPVAD